MSPAPIKRSSSGPTPTMWSPRPSCTPRQEPPSLWPAASAACHDLNTPQHVAARTEFEALFADHALVCAIRDLPHRAGDLSDTDALRGYDAVHLASIEAVADPETMMITADHHLRTATLNHGSATANLPS